MVMAMVMVASAVLYNSVLYRVPIYRVLTEANDEYKRRADWV